MFYTMEEAAIIGGFLELYLDRDSVDPAVREQHRRFRQGLMRGALERADYEIGQPLHCVIEHENGRVRFDFLVPDHDYCGQYEIYDCPVFFRSDLVHAPVYQLHGEQAKYEPKRNIDK